MILIVDVDNLNINLISNMKNIRGRSDLLGRKLRNVDKSVNTGDKLSESAERQQTYDLDLCNVADGVGGHEYIPRVGLLGLISERDTSCVLIEGLNVNGNLLTDRYNIGGMRDSRPRKLGAMYHTVDSAEVYKCAIACKGFDLTGINLALFDILPELCLELLALLACNDTDGCNSAAARLVDLYDLNTLSSSDKSRDISALRYAGMRCGDKYAKTEKIDKNAALYSSLDLTLKYLLSFICGNDLSPADDILDLLSRKSSDTVNIAVLNNDSLNLVAYMILLCNFGSSGLTELGSGDNARDLSAEIYMDLAR